MTTTRNTIRTSQSHGLFQIWATPQPRPVVISLRTAAMGGAITPEEWAFARAAARFATYDRNPPVWSKAPFLTRAEFALYRGHSHTDAQNPRPKWGSPQFVAYKSFGQGLAALIAAARAEADLNDLQAIWDEHGLRDNWNYLLQRQQNKLKTLLQELSTPVFPCGDCGELFSVEEAQHAQDVGLVCESCADEYLQFVDGDLFDPDQTTYFGVFTTPQYGAGAHQVEFHPDDDEIYELHENFHVGIRIGAHRVNITHITRAVRDSGGWYETDDGYVDEDMYYADYDEDPYDDSGDSSARPGVREWNDQGPPGFFDVPAGASRVNLPIGLEFEHDVAGWHAPENILEELDDRTPAGVQAMFIYKADGSLDSVTGVELVSSPILFNDWQDAMSDVVTDTLNNYRATGWDARNGVHLTIGRNWMSPLQEARLLLFMRDTHNRQFLQAVACRMRLFNDAPWGDISSPTLADCRHSVDRTNPLKKRVNLSDKYEPVRVKKDLLEFRLFQSNVKPHALKQYLQFVHAITAWMAPSTGTSIDHRDLVRFIRANKATYPELCDHLAKDEYAPMGLGYYEAKIPNTWG